MPFGVWRVAWRMEGRGFRVEGCAGAEACEGGAGDSEGAVAVGALEPAQAQGSDHRLVRRRIHACGYVYHELHDL